MDFGMIANVVPPARYPNVQRPHLLERSRRSQLIPPFPKTWGRSSPTVQGCRSLMSGGCRCSLQSCHYD